jgi:DNA/RNA endonuclease G (NUC1)
MLSFLFGKPKAASKPRNHSRAKSAPKMGSTTFLTPQRRAENSRESSREKSRENSKEQVSVDFSGSVRSKQVTTVNPDIILLKNHNSILYYSKKLMYPTLVIEVFKTTAHNAGIKRKAMGEPFGPDPRIPLQYQYTKEDYIEYSKLGGSFGHNAAAFLHKSSEQDYRDTFLFSNICPQEIVFNTGLWLLFEHVSEEIIKRYHNAIIINGSVQSGGQVITLGNGKKMAVPHFMYKIILYQKFGKNYYICFVAENKPYYIADEFERAFRKHQRFDLSQYNRDLDLLQKKIGIHFVSSKNFIKDTYDTALLTTKFRNDQMHSSEMYGKIIYSKSMEELQKVVPDPTKLQGFLPIFYQYALEKHGSRQVPMSESRKLLKNPDL